MGSLWLWDLPDVVEATGLDWGVWDGWESRSRSSGGYDAVYAVFCHHTASDTTPESDMSYMWDATSGDQPIGAIYLARTGKVTIGAAGATNTQGKGGPWTLSRGTIPLDKGNAYGIAIEAANRGTGEAWSDDQCSAYVVLVGALCDAYGLDPNRDALSHAEWCAPSCAGRKVDPAGPSPWSYGGTWDMDLFRDDVCAGDGTQPDGEDDVTDDDIERIAQRVWERMLPNPSTGRDTSAGDLLGRYASAWATWTYQLGNPQTGQMEAAGDILRNQ